MHYLNVTPISRRGKIDHDRTMITPAACINHGGFSIYILPQVEGVGYGMTISNKEGDILFTVGDNATGVDD